MKTWDKNGLLSVGVSGVDEPTSELLTVEEAEEGRPESVSATSTRAVIRAILQLRIYHFSI